MTAGERRRALLADARLYLCVGIREDLGSFLDAVLRAGVGVVQLREKHAGPQELMRAARVFREATRAHGTLFIVNDDPSLAVDCDADGVHVGQEDLHPSKAREIVGSEMLVGRSTHSEEEIRRAASEPVDYIGVGPVQETPTKPGRAGTGLGLVRFAREVCSVPFFVTGGMDALTIPAVKEAGAHCFVVVRAITEASDPENAVRAVRAAIEA